MFGLRPVVFKLSAGMDNEILRKLTGHDPQGWKEFVERFSATIQTTVSHVLARRGAYEHDLVLDITQEVFIKLIKNDFRLLKKFNESRSPLSTYISVISRSSTLDTLKKRRIAVDPLPDEMLEIGAFIPEHERASFLDSLPDGLLTEGQLNVLLLLFREELTVLEAAEVLGVEAQTVRSQKHRGIERIRKFIDSRGTRIGVK
jgi:RNA polymerase sigma factor (sigma-70 family)